MTEDALTFGPIEAIDVRRELTWGVPGILAVAGLVATWLLAPHAELSFDALVVATVVVAPGVLASLAAWLGYYRPRRARVRVWASSDGLFLSRHGTWDRVSALRGGDVASGPDGSYQVDLHRVAGERVRLLVPTANDARALLAALGLDRRQGTTLFRVRVHPMPGLEGTLGLLGAWSALVVYASTSWAVHHSSAYVDVGEGHVLGPIAAACMFAAAAWLATRATLAVGADGVHVATLLRRRFVPHGKIRAIVALSSGVALVVDGRRLAFDTRGERLRAGIRCTDPVYDALRLAWSNARPQAATSGAAALARNGKSSAEWIASLRRFGATRAVGYRDVAIEESELLDVLANAEAPAELRAAAAIALSAHDESVHKLRVAADDVADPLVREVALAAASARGPEDLEPALAAVLGA